MFEAREKRGELVTTPCLWFSRGESRRNVGTKLLGAFSLNTFFGASKESINKFFKKVFVHFFVRHKETNQRKAAPSDRGLRLPSEWG